MAVKKTSTVLSQKIGTVVLNMKLESQALQKKANLLQAYLNIETERTYWISRVNVAKICNKSGYIEKTLVVEADIMRQAINKHFDSLKESSFKILQDNGINPADYEDSE